MKSCRGVMFLIFLAISGCSSAPETIFPVIRLTDPVNHQFTFTNKVSAFYFANTHTLNTPDFQGWTVNEHRYLQDYHLLLDDLSIQRDSLLSFNYYPYQFIREYNSGLTETFTMLDSIDALVWELYLPDHSEKIQFTPVLPDSKADIIPPLSKTNQQVILSPVDLTAGSADPGLLWMGFKWILSNRNRVVVLAALESDQGSLQERLDYLSGNYKSLQQHRQKRILKLVQRNSVATNIQEISDAVTWAQISVDALVTRQRGAGIWAGLPWFNNYWGRDTFISLNGALLLSGQFQRAKEILEMFAGYQEKDEDNPLAGRIPNRITNDEVIYNTADGTWWFVRAAYEYLLFTGDTNFARTIFPVVKKAITGALKFKTDPNFFVTHADAETWMDAQYEKGAWSPRGNRAVEIQALWYTALQCAAQLATLNHEPNLAEYWQTIAGTLKENFVNFYWNPVRGQLYDHLNADDSKDTKVRPNQIFSITVPNLPGIEPLLPAEYQMRITNEVLQKLTYRYGVASLWQEDNDFHPWHHYEPLYPQDAAYHNGTVWTWLAGAVISSLNKFHQEGLAYQLFFNEATQILNRDAIGNFSGLLDALPREGERTPRVSGTVSQAWSLAEFIRNFYQDFIGYQPDALHSVIYLNPRIPYEMNSIQLYLLYKNNRIGFFYEELDDRYSFRIESERVQETINIFFHFPGFDPVQFALSRNSFSSSFEFFKEDRSSYLIDDDLEWFFCQPELGDDLNQ